MAIFAEGMDQFVYLFLYEHIINCGYGGGVQSEYIISNFHGPARGDLINASLWLTVVIFEIIMTRELWIEGMSHLISSNCIFQAGETCRVKVISPNKNPFLAGWNCKRPDTSHNITDDLSWLEHIHESSVLGVQLTIPIYLRVVESVFAVTFADFNIHLIRPIKDFVTESSIYRVFAYIVDLVYNRFYLGVLIQNHLGY